MKTLKFDVMRDSPFKILLGVVVPLLLVYGISVFTTSVTNEIYSRTIGPDAFTVTSLISTLLSVMQSIVGSISVAAWIRTASTFQQDDRQNAERSMVSAVYAIIFVSAAVSGVLLLLTNPLLKALHIPAEIYSSVRQYYLIYIGSYFLCAIAAYFLNMVNGLCGPNGIFWANLINNVGPVLVAALLLALLRLKVPGLALISASTSVLLIALSVFLLRKRGIKFVPQKQHYAPDFAHIFRIIRYGLLLSAQSMLCTVGYLAVSVQTNRYLPLEYITVLSVTLPLTCVLNAFSAACTVFVPPNYSAGNKRRCLAFLKLSTAICVGYGVFCFAVSALLGRWYYDHLFEDAAIVEYGANYWFIYGIGLIFVPILYVVRFFLDAAGEAKLSLFAGAFEMLGNLLCACWLIPQFGVIGRSLSYPLGWFFAAVYLISVCILLRRRLFGTEPPPPNNA